MRSKKTTNILLLLAFLFILTIIILCLLPTKGGPADTPVHEGVGGEERRKTTSKAPTDTTRRTTTTTRATTPETTEPPSSSTTEKDYETISTEGTPTEKDYETISTEGITTEKHVPPTTTVKEISSTPSSSSSMTPLTTLKLTTLPKYKVSTTTEHSTQHSTEFQNETYILFKSSTEASSEPPPENATENFTSIPSTTTTSHTTTTTPTTTTTSTTIPSTTTTTTTTTTVIPTTIPYDHTFTLYTEPEGVCTSDGCKDMSGKMLDSLDHEIDPCEDFHEFSCGGVHKDEFLRRENAEENLDAILKEQLVSHETHASKFYDSCLSYLDGTENLKHEENFSPDFKIDFPKSEIPEWPSEDLTKTIGYLINRDLPILFDVTVDVRKVDASIKVLPKLRISLYDDYKENYDHKYCIDQFYRRMQELNSKVEEHVPLTMIENYKKGERPDEGKGKPENLTEAKLGKLFMNSTEDEEIIDVNPIVEYQQYLECMNTTGLDLRINRLESVLMTSDLFAQKLKPLDKQSQVGKVRAILSYLNGILLTPSKTDGAEKPFEIITLGELVGNTVLGGLIKWDSLLENLLGFKLDQSQEIVVEDLEKFSSIFSYFKNTWSDRNLQNVLLMLAGEKLFKKGEDRQHKKNFCFKITKKYLPLDMQLLFTKQFSKEELDVLVSEIYNLGSSLAAEITTLTHSYFNAPTHVEFIDQNILKLDVELLKSQLVLTGNFLFDLHILQTLYRKDMYNMTGKELEDSDSCKLLPREIKFDCNLQMERIIVPLEQLVPPNFYFRKDMPNYLRLEGVAYYYMTKMMALLGTDALNLKDYKGNICLIQNIPTQFVERNSKLRIKYQTHFTEEQKTETLLQFQAFNVAWQGIKTLMSKKSHLKLNETEELPLIWLGTKSLLPFKAFLIRKAQDSCNENKDFDLIRISRFQSPPKSFWINSLLKIDSLFGGAWHCASNSSMAQTRECPPEPTTKDWYNPYESSTPTIYS